MPITMPKIVSQPLIGLYRIPFKVKIKKFFNIFLAAPCGPACRQAGTRKSLATRAGGIIEMGSLCMFFYEFDGREQGDRL